MLKANDKKNMRLKRKYILAALFITLIHSPLILFSQEFDTSGLDRYISNAVAEFEISGLTIVVIKDNEVVYKNGFGWSDEENKMEMEQNAVFNIASLTKAFTAAAIGILDEAFSFEPWISPT